MSDVKVFEEKKVPLADEKFEGDECFYLDQYWNNKYTSCPMEWFGVNSYDVDCKYLGCKLSHQMTIHKFIAWFNEYLQSRQYHGLVLGNPAFHGIHILCQEELDLTSLDFFFTKEYLLDPMKTINIFTTKKVLYSNFFGCNYSYFFCRDQIYLKERDYFLYESFLLQSFVGKFVNIFINGKYHRVSWPKICKYMFSKKANTVYQFYDKCQFNKPIKND